MLIFFLFGWLGSLLVVVVVLVVFGWLVGFFVVVVVAHLHRHSVTKHHLRYR